MPVWLLGFIEKLIEPVVMKIVKEIILSMELNKLQKNRDTVRAAYDELNKAETPEEIRNASKSLGKAWNS